MDCWIVGKQWMYVDTCGFLEGLVSACGCVWIRVEFWMVVEAS